MNKIDPGFLAYLRAATENLIQIKVLYPDYRILTDSQLEAFCSDYGALGVVVLYEGP